MNIKFMITELKDFNMHCLIVKDMKEDRYFDEKDYDRLLKSIFVKYVDYE